MPWSASVDNTSATRALTGGSTRSFLVPGWGARNKYSSVSKLKPFSSGRSPTVPTGRALRPSCSRYIRARGATLPIAPLDILHRAFSWGPIRALEPSRHRHVLRQLATDSAKIASATSRRTPQAGRVALRPRCAPLYGAPSSRPSRRAAGVRTARGARAAGGRRAGEPAAREEERGRGVRKQGAEARRCGVLEPRAEAPARESTRRLS